MTDFPLIEPGMEARSSSLPKRSEDAPVSFDDLLDGARKDDAHESQSRQDTAAADESQAETGGAPQADQAHTDQSAESGKMPEATEEDAQSADSAVEAEGEGARQGTIVVPPAGRGSLQRKPHVGQASQGANQVPGSEGLATTSKGVVQDFGKQNQPDGTESRQSAAKANGETVSNGKSPALKAQPEQGAGAQKVPPQIREDVTGTEKPSPEVPVFKETGQLSGRELAAATQKAPLTPGRVPEFTLRVAEMLRDGGDTEYRATLKLHPEDLGELRVRISLSGDDLELRLFVSSDEALLRIESQMERLRQDLAERGFQADKMQVEIEKGESGGEDAQAAREEDSENGDQQNETQPQPSLRSHDGLVDLLA